MVTIYFKSNTQPIIEGVEGISTETETLINELVANNSNYIIFVKRVKICGAKVANKGTYTFSSTVEEAWGSEENIDVDNDNTNKNIL